MTLFIRLFIIFCSAIPSCLWASDTVSIIKNRESTLIYPVYWHTPLGIHRGTQEHLSRFTNHRTRFNNPQGMTCLGVLNQLSNRDKKIKFQLTVVGVNRGESNLIYNPTLTGLDIIDASSIPALQAPIDVTAGPDGSLFIADTGARAVHIMNPQGGRFHYQRSLTADAYHWQSPSALAAAPNGGCFIADKPAGKIVYINPNYDAAYAFGPELSPSVSLNRPIALAVTTSDEQWSYDKKEYLVICDSNGKRIITTDLQGHIKNIITLGGYCPPSGSPDKSACQLIGNSTTAIAHIALDYYNQIWATSPGDNRIYKFDSNLNLLAVAGRSGTGDYRFTKPAGIAIYRNFGQVFIADQDSVHYFWIGTDIKQAVAQVKKDSRTISLNFFLTEPSFVSISSSRDNEKGSLYNKIRLSSGHHHFMWKEKDPVSEQYQIILQAEATYSSRTHFAKQIILKPIF